MLLKNYKQSNKSNSMKNIFLRKLSYNLLSNLLHSPKPNYQIICYILVSLK